MLVTLRHKDHRKADKSKDEHQAGKAGVLAAKMRMTGLGPAGKMPTGQLPSPLCPFDLRALGQTTCLLPGVARQPWDGSELPLRCAVLVPAPYGLRSHKHTREQTGRWLILVGSGAVP